MSSSWVGIGTSSLCASGDVERRGWRGSAGGLPTVYRLAICIEWTGRGDTNSGVSPLSSVRTVLGGKKEEEGTLLVLSYCITMAYDECMMGFEQFSPTRSPHLSYSGIFDRTGPEIVQYDFDSVLSEGVAFISSFDSDTCTLDC